MTIPAEFEWTLTVLTVASSQNRGERRYRLRVRTSAGDKATDIPPAEVPARIAELCERLGLEGVHMDQEMDLTKLAAIKRDQLDDLDREMGALTEKRKRLAREVKAIEKCASMLAGDAPKRPGGRRAAKGEATTSEKILAALSGGPRTVAQLADDTGVTPKAVGITVGQLAKTGAVVRLGDTVTAKGRRKAA